MADLIKILKDEESCKDLSNKIFKRCMALTMNRQNAQEITQDTFVRALENIDTFDGSNHEAWMFTIARNLFLDNVRRGYYTVRTGDERQRVRREDLHGDTLPDSAGFGLEDGAIISLDLDMCLEKISVEEREILAMNVDYSSKDIADQLGITNANVRVKVSRARTLLANCLGLSRE